MNLSRRRIIKYIRGNLMVFVVFFVVFTLTFYANVIFVDLEDEERKDSAVKRRNVLLYEGSHPDSSADVLLLVLFTSMKNTTDRDTIQLNTIKNWAQFMPQIQPVVYSTFENGPILQVAEQHGWHIHPAPRANKFGTPFLKEMFLDAMVRYDAAYYGFCNGDILFDTGLVNTLQALGGYKHVLQNIMVIGKRKNYYMKRYTENVGPLWRKDITASVGRKDAHFFTNDAEDYFLISKQNFNWTSMKNVVIGRPAYDNYFVGFARKNNVSIVDATKSILALHQTGSDGKFAGAKNKDSKYNRNAIGRFNYHSGAITYAAYYESMSDLFGQVFLKRSPSGWKQYRKQSEPKRNETKGGVEAEAEQEVGNIQEKIEEENGAYKNGVDMGNDNEK